jgi:hypothetical protein
MQLGLPLRISAIGRFVSFFESRMQNTLRLTPAVLVLACVLQCAAQGPDKGYWRAASNNAASITGDIAIGKAKLTLDFRNYPLAAIRSLKPAEVAAVFDADVNTAGQGALYRLNVPASTKLPHHNTLCGTDDTQWMATYLTDPKTLQVAFFSGDAEPVFTIDAVSNSSRLCGTYSFVR